MDDLKYKTKIGFYWTFVNKFATQIMQFVVGIVMARLLSPSDFGITALPAVFMAIASIFMDSGFSQALIRKSEITEKDLSTSFYFSLGMGVFMYLCLFFAAPYIAYFYETPILTPLIRVTALNFLWGPLSTPQNVILKRKLDFKTPARISIISTIVAGIVGIISAYAGYGLWALVISGLLSSLLILIQTWFVVKWLPKERFNNDSFRYLWGFGNKMIGASLIDCIYNNVAPIIIGKYYSTKDLGVYNRAEGYTRLPANQITGILENVAYPVLSKIQDDNESLLRTYRKLIKCSSFVSFPVFTMLAVLAYPLVVVLLTEKWASCVILLQILCFERMTWPISNLNHSFLKVKGRSDLLLRIEIIKRSIAILIVLSALPFGLTFFCLSQWIICLIALIINTYYTGKFFDYGFIKQIKDVMPVFILSLITGLVVFLFNSFITNLILQIIVGLIIGILFFFSMAFVFRFEELSEILYMLKIKK